jgi:hypothetical protein
VRDRRAAGQSAVITVDVEQVEASVGGMRHMVFTLHGRRDSHRYVLIRTGRDWLLHLMR